MNFGLNKIRNYFLRVWKGKSFVLLSSVSIILSGCAERNLETSTGFLLGSEGSIFVSAKANSIASNELNFSPDNIIIERSNSNNFIKEDWNALNILNQQASKVGAIDLDVYSINEKENFSFFDKLEEDCFKFIYLLGADNFNFEKKDKFIVYQGSHGDKGAEIADIILPGSAYTEKDGLFVNLEGRMQNAFKASFPPGSSREDWIILKDIANMMKKPLGFSNSHQLRILIKNYINSQAFNSKKIIKEISFLEENISIKPIDYYYTNSIARSSKVMSECRQISKKLLFTGVEKAS